MANTPKRRRRTAPPVKRKNIFAIAPLPSPTKVYTQNTGRARAPGLIWEMPEWDLAETGRAIDTESLFRRACRNKRNLFLKEGYEFVGNNPKRIKYIKARLAQMELTTGIPFPLLLGNTIASLVRQANAFWVKVRKSQASGGKVRTVGNKVLEPVAGYFPVPAESIRFKRDEYGKVKAYAQYIQGKEEKVWKPEDVVHFYFDKRDGYSVGTPDFASVRDDIRALRRIEEHVELLIHNHLFPLFHFSVGDPQNPASILPDGEDEIDKIRAQIQQMPSDGCFVTPERVKVTPLGAQGKALAFESVLVYFRERIVIGLGNSLIDMGIGNTASRSTAQTMSRNLTDDVKANQKDFGAQFYSFIIQELLLESTFDPETVLEEDNRVYLQFKEIDIEARQAKANHYVDMFLKNAITHEEMRKGIGLKPFEGIAWPSVGDPRKSGNKGTGDWANTSYGLMEREKFIINALDEPATAQSTAFRVSAGGNAVANKNTPNNQHGTRSSTKVNKDSVNETAVPSLDIVYKQQLPLEHTYKNLQEELVWITKNKGISVEIINSAVDSAFIKAEERLVRLTQQSYRIGVQDTNIPYWEVSSLHKDKERIERHVNKYVKKLKRDLIDNLNRHTVKDPVLKREDSIFVKSIFEALAHRAKMIDTNEIMRAYNYGTVKGYQTQGQESLETFRRRSSECIICNSHSLSSDNTDAIIYEEIPPFHPGCVCGIKVK